MSKLYKKYLELKREDNNKVYLFKSGIFYIFISDDAIKMSPVLNLKLTNLNENILKCGFPVNKLNQYLNKIKNLGYDVSIVDSTEEKACSPKMFLLTSDVKNFINELSIIDSNNLSIKEAYRFIDYVTEHAKKLKKEMDIL